MARPNPPNLHELWKWLERDIGTPVTEPEKTYLVDSRYAAMAIPPDCDYPSCLKQLREFRRRAAQQPSPPPRRRGGARRTRYVETDVELDGVATAEELERCRVLARHLAKTAAHAVEVELARTALLGDPEKTMSPDEARAMLNSPASRYLPVAFFRKNGIPLTSHEAVADSEEVVTGPRGPAVMARLTVTWDQGRVQTEAIVPWANPGEEGARHLSVPDSPGLTQRLQIHPGTLLWMLAMSATRLARWSGWTEAEAVWFILTGVAPSPAPVRASTRVTVSPDGRPTLAQVTLHAYPFVSARTLSRVHAAIRRSLLPRKLGPAIGVRGLRLFEFVQERTDWSKRPAWSSIMREWNEAQRHAWCYDDRGHLRRDFFRVAKLLTEPGYRLPKDGAAQQDASLAIGGISTKGVLDLLNRSPTAPRPDAEKAVAATRGAKRSSRTPDASEQDHVREPTGPQDPARLRSAGRKRARSASTSDRRRGS